MGQIEGVDGGGGGEGVDGQVGGNQGGDDQELYETPGDDERGDGGDNEISKRGL